MPTQLLVIEAPGKRQKLSDLLRQVKVEGKSAQWNVAVTRGHVRSQFPYPPYIEQLDQSRMVDHILSQVIRDESRRQYATSNPRARAERRTPDIIAFLDAHPPAPGAKQQINPLPDSNPGRYLGLDPKDTPPFGPWWWVIDPPALNELLVKIRSATDSGGRIWLATDDDDEGEAIAWHVQQIAQSAAIAQSWSGTPDFLRVRLHELTGPEVQTAVDLAVRTRAQVSLPIREAQWFRERADMLIGYTASRALWELGPLPSTPGGSGSLSLGRLQMAALQILLGQEELLMQSVTTFSRTIRGTAGVQTESGTVDVSVSAKDSRATASGLDRRTAKGVVTDVMHGSGSSRVSAFDLNSLQSDAHRHLGLTAAETQRLAQEAYMRGIQSYPRTDSNRVSDEQAERLRQIARGLGLSPSPEHPQETGDAAAGVQGAHGAILPVFSSPAFQAWQTYIRAGSSRGFERHIAESTDSMEGAMLRRSLPTTADARLFDRVCRMSVAAVLPPYTYVTSTLVVDIPEMQIDGQPLRLMGQVRTVTALGPYAILQPNTVGVTMASSGGAPAFAEGQAVNVRNLRVQENAYDPQSFTVQVQVRETLNRRGIGRPSSVADAVETLLARGYTTRADESGDRLSRFGVFITSLAADELGESIDLQATARWDQAGKRIRTLSAERADAAGVEALRQVYSPDWIARTHALRESSRRLGGFGRYGLDRPVALIPYRKGEMSEDNAYHERLSALRGLSSAPDMELMAALRGLIVLKGENGRRVTLEPERWRSHGPLCVYPGKLPLPAGLIVRQRENRLEARLVVMYTGRYGRAFASVGAYRVRELERLITAMLAGALLPWAGLTTLDSGRSFDVSAPHSAADAWAAVRQSIVQALDARFDTTIDATACVAGLRVRESASIWPLLRL